MSVAQKKVVSINRVRAAGYDGASTAARTNSWRDTSASPNSVLTPALALLRARSRAAHRNNPYINKAIKSLVSNEIGMGITARSLSETHKEMLDEYWAEFIKNSDPEGILTFSGQQSQISTGRRLGGEMFIRKRIRRGSNAPSALQIQIIEPEYVPLTLNRKLKNGNKIKAGIEFNKSGQRIAYWMHTEHPLEYTDSFGQMVRIPARDVIHQYMPTRAGQLRGEPDIVQAIVKSYTLDKYEDAEVQRKESKANYTGAVYRDPTVFKAAESDTTVEQGAMPIMPNSLVEMLPGESLDLFDGDQTGSGYDDFMTRQLMSVAAAFNIPYEILSGDWSKINDRLLRGVLNEFRRDIEMQQHHMMIPQVCERVWSWMLEAGVITGNLQLPSYAENMVDYNRVEWSTHAWAYTNPTQDVEARVMEIDNGLKSRGRIVADRGGDVEEVDQQRKEDQDREKELGIERKEPVKPAAMAQPAPAGKR